MILFLDQDNIYLENLDASVVILKKLSDEWSLHSAKHPFLDPLRTTLKSLVVKHEKELASEENAARRDRVPLITFKYCVQDGA
ncbi:hypothetical protein ACH5RR_039348 [Cinchona calisaya]|uniref:Uncharacterized protein n=1 Tax=Cinchona calisaya TaxID=153742 RepID=A0ABD2XZL0_9GENT